MTETALALDARHLAMLQSSAIAPEIIAARGYVSIPPGAVQDAIALGATHSRKILGQILHQGAMAFPVYRCGCPAPSAWVLRPDLPRTSRRGKAIKYEWPSSMPNMLDVLPAYRDAMADPAIPVWFTEGAKKADALASAFGDAILPINLNGVYGWRCPMPSAGCKPC